MKQFLITPAAGKKLIAMALTRHTSLKNALKTGTVVIIAGTTNGYVAEEILNLTEQSPEFSKNRFFRGVVIPPSLPRSASGRLIDKSGFPGDVVIEKGVWKKGKTIFDVVDHLVKGDVILKGANALDITHKKAAILIGDPKGGTIGAALQAVIGRRVRLIIPVGLEKRIHSNLDDLALKLNSPGSEGPRLLPVNGEVFSEIEALKVLCDVKAEIVAAGGVAGAEGSIWLGITGEEESVKNAETILKSIESEKPFEF